MITINSGLIAVLALLALFGFIAYMDLRTCNHCGKKRSDPPKIVSDYLSQYDNWSKEDLDKE